MKITHHPDEATLMSYAAGSLPAALSAVVSLHLDMCEECRHVVHDMETIGAALFETVRPVATDASRTQINLAALKAGANGEVAPTADSPDPDPVVRIVGMPLEDVPWKRLGLGVWHYPVGSSKMNRGDLRLLKVQRGQALPEHGHGGSELTLILEGAYTDHIGTFSAGDVADLDDDVEHRPIACPKDGCICLVASEQKIRFTGMVGRILQPLIGM